MNSRLRQQSAHTLGIFNEVSINLRTFFLFAQGFFPFSKIGED